MTSEERRKRLAQLQSGSVVPVQEVEPETPLDSSNARRERLKVIQSNSALAREKRLEQDPTAFERIVSEPFGRAVERQEAISKRVGEGLREFDFLKDRDPMRAYDPSFGTDAPSVLVQTLTNPISLGFDMAANALLLGAEEAVSFVLPDEMEEGMKKQMMKFMQTDMGQRAISAMTSGAEAWEAFSRAHPNEAANILGGMDAYFAASARVIKNFNPDLRPVKVEKIGLRKVDKPMEGIDKDVYNIAYSKPSGKTKEQAKLTTAPQGPLRIQKQLATEDQLAVVDELKAAGVRGNKTLTENLIATDQYLNALDDSLIKMARRREIPTGPKEPPIRVRADRLRENLNQSIDDMIQQNPAIFESSAAIKGMRRLVDQYMANLSKEGNTIEGLIKARRKLNSDLDRMGADVAGTKLNVNSMGGVAIRSAVNKTIGEEMPEAIKINEKMSRILSVQDNMAMKAANESSNMIGRYIQELGLDKLVGGTAGSILISGVPALVYSVAVSPLAVIRNAMKAEIPARGRAKVKYAVRDVKDQFNKALKDLAKRDPQAAKELLAQKAVVYTALDAAAQKLENEYKETVKQDGS